MNGTVQQFKNQLAPVNSLVPRMPDGTKRKVAQPAWTKQVVTIVGVKTVLNRFLPVSHEGHSNESYVDKIELEGRTRAEFIGRKMKGIERRMHMALFRELAATEHEGDWRKFFDNHYNTTCVIPDGLCIACWNCALFGGLDAKGQIATFSRVRYFDTFSVEPAEDCIGSMDNEEMGIGNQVYEDLAADKEGKYRRRSSETYHLYEYVKAGTHFPFITMIESPSLLDVAGLLHAIRRADIHGYGKYNANHGKFRTKFLAVATGYPRFSILDMLPLMQEGGQHAMDFDGLISGNGVVLTSKDDIEAIAGELQTEFKSYVQSLG